MCIFALIARPAMPRERVHQALPSQWIVFVLYSCGCLVWGAYRAGDSRAENLEPEDSPPGILPCVLS